jgi:hypothetical protein
VALLLLLLCCCASLQLLARLQELGGLINSIVQISNLMVLHTGHALTSAGTTHILTGQALQASSLQSSHYASAVRRLRLTSRQVLHFRMMLQQYNRITQQQARAGQQLVGLSENSLSLQASLSGAPSTQPSGTSILLGKQGDGSEHGAVEPPADETWSPALQTGSDTVASAATDEAAAETTTPL